MLSLIVVVALLATAFFLYSRKPREKSAQDIVGGTNISQDGIIQHENTFRLVIEVEPVNLDTASETEHKNVWLNFVTMINTLSVPYTLLMHSEYFEMRDYTDDLDKRLKELNLPAALYESGLATKGYLSTSTEEAKIRDFRGYLILQYNPVQTTQNGGVETGVRQLDLLIGKVGKKTTKMSESEKLDLAEQVLKDAAAIVFSFCEQAGIRYQLLNKAGALNVSYQILQRDMAPYSRMNDAIQQNAFYPMKHSITVDHV